VAKTEPSVKPNTCETYVLVPFFVVNGFSLIISM
jgi:hypothetical protein